MTIEPHRPLRRAAASFGRSRADAAGAAWVRRRAGPALRTVLGAAALGLAVLGLLRPGSAATGQSGETGKPHVPAISLTLTGADDGNTVAVRVGDHLVLRLDENPTTGYRWALETPDQEVIALQQVEYLRARDAAVGGGGQRAWTFIARKAGMATLSLKLWRSWEGDASVRKRFTATVRIGE